MSCPRCGGLIHPVAGRCRHCKADLSAHRSSRPAAAAALPPLVAATAPIEAAPRTEFAPLPVAAAYAADLGSTPVLPPRPTGRQDAAPARGLWRTWPIIVIVLAAIAIVAALVLMLWPPATPEAKADPRVLRPPPAPERMDVTPVLPTPQPNVIPGAPGAPGGADPWAAPTPPPGTVPQQVPDLDPDPAPAPTPDPDDLSADPFANPFGPGGGGAGGGAAGGGGAGGMFGGDARSYITLAARACKKLASCSPDLGEYCTVIDTLADGTLPTCPAAQRCVDRIEGLSCANLQGGSTVDLLLLMSTLQECMNLANC